ncbi:MAG: hypothetical protein JWN03_1151 [Nocardia sp.]|nr:hypothetical protein [Nocardia sp.]
MPEDDSADDDLRPMGRGLFRSSGRAIWQARSDQRTEELTDLLASVIRMPASRFILEVQARGHDPVRVLNELTPEFQRLFQ